MEQEKDTLIRLQQRRELLVRMGTGLVAISVGTVWGQVAPSRARSHGVRLRHLSAEEGLTLEALGEVLLPGAREAGIVPYVDDQLGRDAPLFVLRYLDYPGSYTDFYKQGLQSLDGVSRARHEQPFPDLSGNQQIALVREISGTNPVGWNGPPAPLFYFVTRNDAVDVCYGTQEGFARLAVPYMAHIAPAQKW
jgi:hypothetical protein